VTIPKREDMNNSEEPKKELKKEDGLVGKFLKDVILLDRYTTYKNKQDFFLDIQSFETEEIDMALMEFLHENPALCTDKQSNTHKYQSFGSMLSYITTGLYNQKCKLYQHVHTIDQTTYIVTIIRHVTSKQYVRSVSMLPRTYQKSGKAVLIDHDCQAHGGSQTYMKRYALKSLLGIEVDDDYDGR